MRNKGHASNLLEATWWRSATMSIDISYLARKF